MAKRSWFLHRTAGWFGAVLAVMIAVSPATSRGAEPITEPLWAGKAPGAVGEEDKDRPRVIVYRADEAVATGTGLVIYPGGGYGGLAMGHEGHEIAKWAQSLGMTGVIVDYRHRGKGYRHPAPLLDAQRAIRLTRARAADWGIRPDRVGVIGFSAGGHLASTTVTHFDNGTPDANDPVDRQGCRPDFGILCYPVIALGETYTHRGSQRNLLGDKPDVALVRKLSSEKQVTAKTPPCFLWHTDQDQVVLPENSVRFYLALRAAKVAAELHIYERGRHGLGLARTTPGTSQWSGACAAWLKARGFLKR